MSNFPRQAQKHRFLHKAGSQCLFFPLSSTFRPANIKGIVSGPLELLFPGRSKTHRDSEYGLCTQFPSFSVNQNISLSYITCSVKYRLGASTKCEQTL